MGSSDKRRRYTDEEKRQHVADALASGNIAKYLKEHKLNNSSFFNWRKLLPGGTKPGPKVAKAAPGRRRTFTREQKAKYAAAAVASGSPNAWAEKQGFATSMVHNWVKKYKPGSKAPKKPTKGRGSMSEAEQRKHVAAAFAPNVNARAYARAHGINEGTIYYWFKKFNGVSKRDVGSPKNGHAKNGHSAAEAVADQVERRAMAGSGRSKADELRELRLENLVLKSTLRLAEMRGFSLLGIGDVDEQEGRPS